VSRCVCVLLNGRKHVLIAPVITHCKQKVNSTLARRRTSRCHRRCRPLLQHCFQRLLLLLR
jgi:hypothetical protein